MEKMFCLGLALGALGGALAVALGALGGALAVANSCKMRSLVKKSQEELIDKLDDAVDARLDAMERAAKKRDRD